MSRTKIVATIGPATRDVERVRELVAAGMSVARLNAAHADLDWHGETIDRIRAAAPEIPILIDLPGSKVRTKELEPPLAFQTGDRITFTTAAGDPAGRVPVSGAALHEKLAVGDLLSADDGAISFQVTSIAGEDVVCTAQCDGTLRSCKGISLPSSAALDQITDRDRQIIEFAAEKGVDFVGVSFVSSARHIEAVREIAGGTGPRIIAKIESREGLDKLDEIAAATDGLLIDRGDLSVQTSLETLVLAQKQIVEVARSVAKPVIIATEMLHSMIENPVPTKAEVCDISNAVLDGASALMLSGETAVGRFPVEAVKVMHRIASAVVAHDQDTLDRQVDQATRGIPPAVTEAVSLLTRRLPVTKIIAITIGGYAAEMVAASRPRQPILAVSNNPATVRRLNLLPGTEGVFVDIQFSRSSTDHIPQCLEILWQQDRIQDADLVLVTSLGYPKSGNRMNMIEMHAVADLAEALGWQRRHTNASRTQPEIAVRPSESRLAT